LKFLLLDKMEKTWYNNKAVGREDITKDSPQKINQKFFEKSLKKDLTNSKKCGIINEFADEPDGSYRAQSGQPTKESLKRKIQKNLKKDLTND